MLTQEQLDLEAKRFALITQIGDLKAQAAEVKKQYDKLTLRLNLAHKLKDLSPAEIALLKGDG